MINNDVKEALAQFCDTIAKLRDKEFGCPWMLSQTHSTLMPYLVEEAYEVCHALALQQPTELCQELGDILLQVVLHAQLGSEQGTFSLVDIINAIDEKMKRRHPHVFAKDKSSIQLSLEAIEKQWEQIKNTEEKNTTKSSYFNKTHKVFPATKQAYKIGKLARKINFDWAHPDQVFEQLESEWHEVKEAWTKNKTSQLEDLVDELGDLYFSLAQFCRHLDLDPELVAAKGNQKFLDRFAIIEKIAKEKGVELRELSQEELENLWHAAKQSQAKQK